MRLCFTFSQELNAQDTDKYLEHVLDYCKKDYQQAYKKKTSEE